MARIAVLYCKKIKDHSCVGCAKCHKAIAEKNGEYGRFDEIELIAMSDCGDCPGLAVPRIKLLKGTAQSLGRDFEVVYLGTCVKLAMETAQCPIDVDKLRPMVKAKFGCELIVGTHTY